MKEKYKCKICGKKHQIFRSLESPDPELIRQIPESERKNRIKEVNGFYLIDKKILLGKGYIQIMLENFEEPLFFWNVWGSMELDQFQSKFENLYKQKRLEFEGKLESEIPFYDKSKGLRIKLEILHPPEFEIEIRIDETSKLREDQSSPISEARVNELMERIHHNELYKEVTEFEIPFGTRLKEELQNVEKKYLRKNKNFTINFNSPNSLLFQIVNNQMLESKKNNINGFGFHLSFDKSFEESKTEINNFKQTEFFNEFIFHELDGIPVFQLDLQDKKESIEKLARRLLKEVYCQKNELVEIESYEM